MRDATFGCDVGEAFAVRRNGHRLRDVTATIDMNAFLLTTSHGTARGVVYQEISEYGDMQKIGKKYLLVIGMVLSSRHDSHSLS